ncbi:MAG: hypothetical protein SNJ67_10485 [Chloracidobacterium sp.]|uniref:Uncharacterized protein n=1 Tax=Chloracidobacterium validum TaxID=2821543 RepID=A0ABX8BD19_9BACT|nr:hypothetical protein [Chloracidobacterium validum]QUW04591.1 hypothetical protein J8C06_12470 [Chloracidobacterium validum]
MLPQPEWWLHIINAPRTTSFGLPADQAWVAVGSGSDCDIVVDEPDIQQLAFQLNRRPNGDLWLYVHPAWLWSRAGARRANLRESIFPLDDPTVIAMSNASTRFILTRQATLSEAEHAACLAQAECAWAQSGMLPLRSSGSLPLSRPESASDPD